LKTLKGQLEKFIILEGAAYEKEDGRKEERKEENW
jgi:hypothetical protein